MNVIWLGNNRLKFKTVLWRSNNSKLLTVASSDSIHKNKNPGNLRRDF